MVFPHLSIPVAQPPAGRAAGQVCRHGPMTPLRPCRSLAAFRIGSLTFQPKRLPSLTFRFSTTKHYSRHYASATQPDDSGPDQIPPIRHVEVDRHWGQDGMQKLRTLMRTVPYPVAIVTTCHQKPDVDYRQSTYAATVSSFNTVSFASAPYVSFNLAINSRTQATIAETDHFSITVLQDTATAARLADRFTRGNKFSPFSGHDEAFGHQKIQFNDWEWGFSKAAKKHRPQNLRRLPPGLHVNRATAFTMLCQKTQAVAAGDHVVIIGRVLRIGGEVLSNWAGTCYTNEKAIEPPDRCLSYAHGAYSTDIHGNGLEDLWKKADPYHNVDFHFASEQERTDAVYQYERFVTQLRDALKLRTRVKEERWSTAKIKTETLIALTNYYERRLLEATLALGTEATDLLKTVNTPIASDVGHWRPLSGVQELEVQKRLTRSMSDLTAEADLLGSKVADLTQKISSLDNNSDILSYPDDSSDSNGDNVQEVSVPSLSGGTPVQGDLQTDAVRGDNAGNMVENGQSSNELQSSEDPSEDSNELWKKLVNSLSHHKRRHALLQIAIGRKSNTYSKNLSISDSASANLFVSSRQDHTVAQLREEYIQTSGDLAQLKLNHLIAQSEKLPKVRVTTADGESPETLETAETSTRDGLSELASQTITSRTTKEFTSYKASESRLVQQLLLLEGLIANRASSKAQETLFKSNSDPALTVKDAAGADGKTTDYSEKVT